MATRPTAPARRKRRLKAAPPPPAQALAQPPGSRDGLALDYGPHPQRIVGIGASAGGLDAFRELLSNLPETTGMAFVLVQHLASDQKSMLAEILSRSTRMPVIEVSGDTPVVANRIYVIPPFADMTIRRGVLRLEKRTPAGQHMPIDLFFISLAEANGPDAIGVILSGADRDGTQGARAIKEAGGLTFAQDASALFDGMPSSAANSGVIDHRLSPRAIAEKLAVVATEPSAPLQEEWAAGEFDRILRLLLGDRRVNLAQYKTPTIQRRIERRMSLSQHTSLADYGQRLEEDADERDALYKDMLIGVTRFFREPEKLNSVKKKVLPELLKEPPPGHVLRVWIPGCSTGEEAYSLAMVVVEFLEEKSLDVAVQVFATDVNGESIAYARAGHYPESIQRDVSAARLARFFVKDRAGFTVNKILRGFCVFAQHDLLRNPPFSRLDLISCSNVLIYLQDIQQQRLIATFRYALKPEGFLILGASESTGGDAGGFTAMDRKQKIYRVTPGKRSHFDLTRHLAGRSSYGTGIKPAAETSPPIEDDIGRRIDSALLARFSPPCIVLSDSMEIIEWRGDIQRFLSLAPGIPSLRLPKVVPENLLMEIRMGVEAIRKGEVTIRRGPLTIRTGKQAVSIVLDILPVALEGSAPSFIVTFEESAPREKDAVRGVSKRAGRVAGTENVRKELAIAREYLRDLTERHESADRDARNASEELQSANEELQSTIEELETAKEELQSTNEELTTLNDELRARNTDLLHLGDDLMNLLGGIDTPVVMVDRDLTVRRFNPTAQRLLNLLGTDLGRPIYAFKPLLDIPEFSESIQRVIDTAGLVEQDVQDRLGHWYSLRMRPYHTARHEITGVVITLVDIHDLRSLLDRAEVARRTAEEARGAADEARVEAMEANRLKDEFLSTLSHELRTPITSILGWAQMMRMTGLNADTVGLGVDSIERSTKAQIRLIDDLLDVSRITAGRLRLDQTALELARLVEETLTVIRPAAEAKSIRVSVEENSERVMVRADPDRLRQVIWNVLINAVKFTPDGGTIAILIDGDGVRARLTIRDTGAGIDPEFLPFVFERFSQAEGGTRRLRSGLGLGLAITKYLVELHGGTIAAQSDGVGKGSTFTISLPVFSGDPAVPAPAALQDPPREFPEFNGVRVLVVDDDVDTRSFVSAFLERCGADVTIASTASEGFEALRRGNPHLVLSDIAMPGEDGFDFLKSIRSLPSPEGETPVIALTAYTSPEDRARILAAGFTGYMSKPVSLTDLARCIESTLEKERSRSNPGAA